MVFVHRDERAVKHQQIYSYHATTSISLRERWQNIDDNGEESAMTMTVFFDKLADNVLPKTHDRRNQIKRLIVLAGVVSRLSG